MKIPITREDFVALGRKIKTDAIMKEIDRLVPIAREDAEALAEHEYTPDMLDQLIAYRDQLAAESSHKQETRHAAKGATVTEQATITESKNRRQEKKTRADDLDEIDGRAFYNLKLLCKTGRAHFLEAGDPTRAAAYQLNDLHSRPRKARPTADPNTPTE